MRNDASEEHEFDLYLARMVTALQNLAEAPADERIWRFHAEVIVRLDAEFSQCFTCEEEILNSFR